MDIRRYIDKAVRFRVRRMIHDVKTKEVLLDLNLISDKSKQIAKNGDIVSSLSAKSLFNAIHQAMNSIREKDLDAAEGFVKKAIKETRGISSKYGSTKLWEKCKLALLDISELKRKLP